MDSWSNRNSFSNTINSVNTENVWGNKICTTSDVCALLEECDKRFGCTRSFSKCVIVVVTVTILIFVLTSGIRYCCARYHGRNESPTDHPSFGVSTLFGSSRSSFTNHHSSSGHATHQSIGFHV